MNSMNAIAVPVSPGELLDKITILRIKSARIVDPGKLGNVRRELALLEHSWRASVPAGAGLAADETALERVNTELWDIEDAIRRHESQQRFDADFIALARAVYLRNDERAAIKQRINLSLNSAIIEEKSYQPYR
jgi:isopropylmalate/homocitrate/citramalate synthase